ncbi:band 7 protein [Pyrolobus fumarii 1A]|uniref:Band 7 protein n=1 Tax=Pyrolobus fumarii (strain DSM 11204 / 1A) TaxID=694429 RepID=G0EFG5_PYRF1|nr:SPFH domain-containing protein [Pyrolobus fumarii]AEM38989.1 band 7 protein [Pyrolobus fumarii 1A]
MTRATVLKALRLLTVLAAIIAIVFVAMVAMSTYQLDVGEAAVIIDPVQGRIVGVVFGPHFGFKMPWQEIRVIPVSVQTVLLEDQSAVIAVTRDGARVPVEIQVRYEVRKDPAAVKYLIQKYPENPHERIKREVIERAAYEAVRSVIGKYNLVEIVPRIQEISEEIAAYLKQLLLEDPSVKAAIDIVDVVVKSIDIPKELSQAILRKLAAQQEAEAAKFEAQKEIIRAEMEAKKKIIAANATAMQQIIAARAEAEKRVIEANATAQKMLIEAMAQAKSVVERYRGEAAAIKAIMEELNVTAEEAAKIYYYIKMIELYREVLPEALRNASITLLVTPSGNQTLPLVGVIPLPSR